MKGITSACFGKRKSGETVREYTLTNESGASVSVLDLGCTIRSIRVPDKNGVLRDVCLGWEALESYEGDSAYLGATVGRCANRTAGGRFTLGGQEYTLFCNDGQNHLHGGKEGFNSYIWAHAIKGEKLVFTRTSPDGEEGYPGNLQVSVAFSFSDQNELLIQYTASSDRETVLSLTNHAYFNLEGEGDVLSHTLTVQADAFTPTDAGLIPTGEIRPVEGTPFDFTQPKTLGRDISQPDGQLTTAGGYDHNFCLRGTGMRLAALLEAPHSGITLEVSTDLPGIQIYTSNFLKSTGAKGGGAYAPRQAVCLETQHYPNAVNTPGFPSPILHAGEEFYSQTSYRFGCIKD